MNYRILNVCTDVNAYDGTRVCVDAVKESVTKVDFGRKIPCDTGGSNLRQRRAGPTLYQLRYNPTENIVVNRESDLCFVEIFSPQFTRRLRSFSQYG